MMAPSREPPAPEMEMARARSTAADRVEDDSVDDEVEFDIGPSEVVANKIDLRKKVRRTARRAGDADPIAAAEAAVQELAASFDGWMHGELDTLVMRWHEAGMDGYGAGSRDALFRAAHDIKGQAATLGYPLVGEAAGSLCHLLLEGPESSRLPLSLVDQHVQAIRAMIREQAREENRTARLLAERLTSVTDEFIASIARAA